MQRWLRRFKSIAVPEPKAKLGVSLYGAFGAGLAVLIVGVIGDLSHAPLLIAPLGATALLLFAVPDSIMSQPRNVMLGHLIAVILGIGFARLIGPGWPAAAPAVFVSIALMVGLRSLHAPAGATAVLSALEPHDWSFIGLPVMAGAAAMLLLALFLHALVPGRRYPVRWF